MFTHRVLAILVGILVGVVAARSWQARRVRPAAAVLGVVAAALFVAQVLIGAANVWTRLAPSAVVAHVAVSSLIWGALVAAGAAARASPREGARGAELAPVVALHGRSEAPGRSEVAPR
jgi:heme A synthase